MSGRNPARSSVGGKHRLLYVCNTQAAKTVNPAHPFGIALGQVVIDCDNVAALAAPAGNCRRHGGGESLTLAGSHLHNAAAIKGESARDLDKKRSLTYLTTCYLPDQCKGPLEVRRTVASATKNLSKLIGKLT